MGKNKAKQNVQPKSVPTESKRGTLRPFVSVICPTYNRRQFLPNLIHQFNYQTYPQEYMELVILDDSPESNADIIPPQPNIKYTHLKEKLILGKKRNLLNSMATGDIIVCFDDDDFYSQERVSHAVNKLQVSKCQIAGSSVIHIFYPKLNKIYQFGPYAPYHGTNGTMAYTKKYLKTHSYLDDKPQAEEAHFTNNFSEPMVQLDPQKVMICVAHNKNTVEKDQFLNQGKETGIKIQKFFKTKDKHMLDYLKTLGDKLNAEVSAKSVEQIVPEVVDDLEQKRQEFARQLKDKNVQISDDVLKHIQPDQMEQILGQITANTQFSDLEQKRQEFARQLKEKNVQISDDILNSIQPDQMEQILAQVANFMISQPQPSQPPLADEEEPLTNIINPPV